MKKCPKCGSQFTDENSYCLHDGTVLVEEPPPTVAFHRQHEIQPETRFVGNSPGREDETTKFPPHPSVHQEKSSFKKSLTLLLTGLFIGGGLIAALVFLLSFKQEVQIPSSRQQHPQFRAGCMISETTRGRIRSLTVL